MLELMIAIAVVTLLTLIALPSFTDLMNRNRLASGANSLMAGINLARMEAIKTNAGASICASTDGATCNNNPALWGDGWIIWADVDQSGTVNNAEVILRTQERLGNINITSPVSTISRLTFDGRGLPVGMPANATMLMQPATCKPGSNNLRNISIGVVGLVRVAEAPCP
ncbi:hypothetical protein N789_02810 [Arenimonas oryziterrae DSM 21050 = YC6267]|uniref:Type II secretion system protein H n=1 Tax=Arenimonas oryziterrae DSM 21050 = YC6267 TaxID=1121015 RepID=A0A091AZX6_9GAMM|nr:hypothetical protein N789_02810 [Arenimonas oryziterrae DSM 21050 = YC6267]